MAYPQLQTPQKPLPGAYIQTPPVSRFQSLQPRPSNLRSSSALSQQQRSLQSQSQALGQQAQPAIQNQSVEDVKPIARASKAINDTLAEESRYPELDSYIGRVSQQSKQIVQRLI